MPKNNDNLKLGREGEKRAKNHLKWKGYKILKTNYRYKKGEIDIIASNEKFTIFVEVKTRSNTSYGNPEEAVSKKKESLIKSVAQQFMNLYGSKDLIRFDIIAITKNKNNKFELEHFEDAF